MEFLKRIKKKLIELALPYVPMALAVKVKLDKAKKALTKKRKVKAPWKKKKK